MECRALFGFGQAQTVNDEFADFHRPRWPAAIAICVGVLMVVGSTGLLGWNEFNHVANKRVIWYVSENAVNTSANAGCIPSQLNANKGVFVSCPVSRLAPVQSILQTAQTARYDYTWAGSGTYATVSPQFYGWLEQSNPVQGGGPSQCQTRFSYKLGWVAASTYNPSSFGCYNASLPAGFCCNITASCLNNISACLQTRPSADWTSQTYFAGPNSVGIGDTSPAASAYLLNNCPSSGAAWPCTTTGTGTGMLSAWGSVQWGPVTFGTGSPWTGKRAYRTLGGSVVYASGGALRAGDYKLTFAKSDVALGMAFTVIAFQGDPEGFGYQAGDVQLKPWDTKLGGSLGIVNWFSVGTKTMEQMIHEKVTKNDAITWILRFVGFLTMLLGLQMITGPIAVMPHLFPCGIGDCLGEILGCMLCILNLLVATAMSFMIIAIAWLAARPLVGSVFLAAAVILLGAAMFLQRKRRDSQSLLHLNKILMLQVRCPLDVLPGETVAVAHEGLEYCVRVPEGVAPGQPFAVQLSAVTPQSRIP